MRGGGRVVVGYPQTHVQTPPYAPKPSSARLLPRPCSSCLSTALADCVNDRSPRRPSRAAIAEYYPQPCYSAALKTLGPDVNTYSPNVARNLKSAMRRDRTRKLKITIQWLPKNKVRVTSNYKLKSSIQLRKGAKILTKGSISAQDDDAQAEEDRRQAHRGADLGARQEEDHGHEARDAREGRQEEEVVTVAASRRPRRCSSIGSPNAALSVAGVSAVATGPCATLAPSRMRSACVAQAGMSST